LAGRWKIPLENHFKSSAPRGARWLQIEMIRFELENRLTAASSGHFAPLFRLPQDPGLDTEMIAFGQTFFFLKNSPQKKDGGNQ